MKRPEFSKLINLALKKVSLTFLLVSGMRKAMAFDPDISISRVKELVWMSWPTGTYDE